MLRKLTNLSFALLFMQPAIAETAGDYFHRGAQKYVFGQKEAAKAEITEGLQKFPDDEELRGIYAFFREEEQKQSQDQQEQKDQQNQERKDEQQKQDGKKQEQQKDGGQQQEKKGDDGKQKDGKPESKDGQTGEPKDGKDGAKPEEMPGQSDKKLSGEVKANSSPAEAEKDAAEAEALAEEEAAAEGKMTERQAKALLDSLKGDDDRVRLLDPNERKRGGRVLRDW